MNTVNIWAIIVASIVAMVIGAIWYSPMLFGKEWMSLTKMSDKDMSTKKKGVWLLYVYQLIATIVSFAVLGFFISSSSGISAADGAFLGFLVWLGFVAPIAVSMLSWEKRPLKLVAINAVNMLLTLVIGGAIIGGWR